MAEAKVNMPILPNSKQNPERGVARVDQQGTEA